MVKDLETNKKEIKKLENVILYHKKKYYEGEPEISDNAYDSIEDKLRELDPDNPVLHIIGSSEGGKIVHDTPMLSCQKATDIDDVVKWSNNLDLLVDYKIDGFSLSLIYEGGKLIQAATRGNGMTGDDSTIMVMKLSSIPKRIPEIGHINIRGELYMPISEFDRINKIEKGSYISPRNLAVGTIKQKDLRLLDERSLDFFAFDLIGFKDRSSLKTKNIILKTWGFSPAQIGFIKKPSKKDIESLYQKIEAERPNLDFEIDGLIFKYNEAIDREAAGVTSHHPKWMLALKFSSEGKNALVNGITWQVGRMGTITPVAELDPVDIMGANIRRATLHNAEFLENLNVAVGDTVHIIRSGDVIPKITEVVVKGENNARFPKKCPSCGSTPKREGVNLICTGKECREREIQKIRYFVKIVDLYGLGPKNIAKLYDTKILRHFSDLYDPKLTESKLISLLGKNGSKIYESIQVNREIPFHTFLASLGIENLGKEMAKTLATHFKNYEQLKNATIKQLIEIEGISDIIASNIHKGVNDPTLGDQLLSKGVKIFYGKQISKKIFQRKGTLTDFLGISDSVVPTESDETAQEKLGEKSVYVTGKVEGMTKKKIEDLLEKKNFRWASISKTLDFLVTGDKPGRAKIEKAKKYDIQIIGWEEFNKRYLRN